jgi:hypothetical protein
MYNEDYMIYDTFLDTENLDYLTKSTENFFLYCKCAGINAASHKHYNGSEYFKSLKREYRVRKNSYRRHANAVWNHQSVNGFAHLAEDGDAYIVRYYTIPFEGTKEELLDEFDQYYASKINSPYDCTGEWFTTSARFAKIDDNHWFVRECLAKDI